VGRLVAERDTLEARLDRLLPEYFAQIESGLRPTSVIERFAQNYPHHERLPEMLRLLSENYRESGRADRALETCARIHDEYPDSDAWQECLGMVPSLVKAAESPIVVQKILDTDLPPMTHDVAAARMDSLVAHVESMEEAAAFVERFPESAYATPMRDRLDQEADSAFRQARILEGVARQQQALDSYHRILFLAPDSPAATRARERIDFLVRTG
jgi:hypothetical protein